MANGLNKVMVIGNLAKDAQLTHVGEQGTAKASFRLLTTTGYGDHEHTEGFNCVLWGKRADGLAPHLKKGKRVYVEGEMRTRSYEKDGERRYFTDLRVSELIFQPQGGHRAASEPGGDVPPADEVENEIPF